MASAFPGRTGALSGGRQRRRAQRRDRHSPLDLSLDRRPHRCRLCRWRVKHQGGGVYTKWLKVAEALTVSDRSATNKLTKWVVE